jgi:hypothetical protein
MTEKCQNFEIPDKKHFFTQHFFLMQSLPSKLSFFQDTKINNFLEIDKRTQSSDIYAEIF